MHSHFLSCLRLDLSIVPLPPFNHNSSGGFWKNFCLKIRIYVNTDYLPVHCPVQFKLCITMHVTHFSQSVSYPNWCTRSLPAAAVFNLVGIHWCPPSPPLDNIRIMVIVWRSRGNIIRTALCRFVWHKMLTVRSTLMWAVLTGSTDWVCHIGTLTLCVEAVA